MTLDGADEYSDHAAVVFTLLSLLAAMQSCKSLRSPRARLETLQAWELDVGPRGGLNPLVVMAAVEGILAANGTPALQVLKFAEMSKPGKAISTATNAAWDLHFLRLLQRSEAGSDTYEDDPRRTVLLTCDKWMAAASEALTDMVAVRGEQSAHLAAGWNYAERLAKRHAADPAIMSALRNWLGDVHDRQLQRALVGAELAQVRQAEIRSLADRVETHAAAGA